MAIAKTYAVCLTTFLILDGIWLSLMAGRFYQKFIGNMFTDNVVWWAALLFYVIHVAGVVYFAVLPAARAGSMKRLLIASAFFGVCAYGTWDLTNLAVIRDWPWGVSVVDVFWGMSVSVAVALSGYWSARSNINESADPKAG